MYSCIVLGLQQNAGIPSAERGVGFMFVLLSSVLTVELDSLPKEKQNKQKKKSRKQKL